MNLVERIKARSKEADFAGGSVQVLPVAEELALAREGAPSQKEVQLAALRAGILPARYLRSFGTVGLAGQETLLKACVAIIGAGGLGGWIVELLTRMGVGRLIVVDGDRFDDNNLNRQLLATQGNLGAAKALAARDRAAQLNGAVTVEAHVAWLTGENAREFLAPAQVVVDALDNLPARFILQDAAGELGLPLVHGAIAGYQGQVMTIFPGDQGLNLLYPGGREGRDRGVEVQLGNPAATPAMVASWQVQETIKILLVQGEPLRNRLLYLDALGGTAEVLQLLP
ncbi:MAG TPA: HesA/MoeB/ThiF family protein [Firmicutes bacterium]|jgi:molybdopterin/thiamine biosynthesis adenylyltransferase|nr:HesA/MoeB/ThiF family protein [Bacillota bacterium]